jgi:hypothetical protein
MITVYRYILQPTNNSVVAMPEGAEILQVARWKQKDCIWALVDTDKPLVPRVFHVLASGSTADFPSYKLHYIGSFVTDPDIEIYHLFEVLT